MKSAREICKKSLAGLLKPVARFAIRHSIKYRDAAEFLKIVFIEAAREELANLKEEPTISKISAMTGIQRPEAARLIKEQPSDTGGNDIITRVIGMWQNSARFRDKSGKPKRLSNSGRDSQFGKLVSLVSTDLNPYTVAFELERAGIIKSTEHGLMLIKPGYESADNIENGLALLAEDLNDLHSSVNENIFHKSEVSNLHIKTAFDNIPISKASLVREWFLEQGDKLHNKAREFLAGLDRDISPEMKKKYPEESSIRAVIGTYSLTEEEK